MKYAALSGAVLIPLLTLMASAGGGAPSGEGEADEAARPAPFLSAEDPRTFRLHGSRIDCIVFPLTTYRVQHLTVRLRTVVGGKPVVVGERTYGWNVGDFTDGKAIVGALLILAEGGAAAGGEGPPVITFDVDYPFGT